MLFTRDGHNVFFGDSYRGAAAFLIGAGPSLCSHDLTALADRGIVTMAMNNAATVVRSNLWVSVDDPTHFVDAIWRDPGILKFVPLDHMEKPIAVREPDGNLVLAADRVGDMPAVFGYRRNENFRAEQFLDENTFNWGNHSDKVDAYGNKGSRSVMYVALRLLHYLGFRRIFLLGCDFRMQHGQQNYAFDQDRSPSSVRSNNDSYRILNERLSHLKPHFDRTGFSVFNCTPGSGLTVFPHVPFEQALCEAKSRIPDKIVTAGMYDAGPLAKVKPRSPPASRSHVELERLGASSNTAPPPEFTLILTVDEAQWRPFQEYGQDWFQSKPELKAAPMIIVHDRELSKRRLDPPWLQQRHGVTFVPWDFGSQPTSARANAMVRVPAEHARTPWYLHLDASARSTRSGRWINGEWFHARQGALPAYVAHAWGYLKPPQIIAVLDRWSEQHSELARMPPLAPRFPASSDRVRVPAFSSWCFFGATEVARQIHALTSNGLPCESHDALFWYVAERLGRWGERVNMKRLGWDHHFHRISRRR